VNSSKNAKVTIVMIVTHPRGYLGKKNIFCKKEEKNIFQVYPQGQNIVTLRHYRHFLFFLNFIIYFLIKVVKIVTMSEDTFYKSDFLILAF